MKEIKINLKIILSVTTLVLSFAYFFIMLCFNKKSDAQIITAIVALNMTVFNFEFGSSAGSVSKDKIIKNMSDKENTSKIVLDSEITNKILK